MKFLFNGVSTFIPQTAQRDTVILVLLCLIFFLPVFIFDREFNYFFNQGPTIILIPSTILIIALAGLKGVNVIALDDFSKLSIMVFGIVMLHCAVFGVLFFNWNYLFFMIIWVLFYLLYQPISGTKNMFPTWSTWLFQIIILSQLLFSIAYCKPGVYKFIAGFDNPNQFSQFLVIMSTFSLINITSKFRDKPILKKVSVLNVLGVIAVIIVNGSRTSILAIAVIIVIIVALRAKHPKFILLTTIFVLLTAFTYFLIRKSDSSNGRLLVYKISLQAIKKSPYFGSGFNMFPKTYNETQELYFTEERAQSEKTVAGNVSYAYNELIHLFIEFGLVPTFMLLLLFLRYYQKCWVQTSSNPENEVSLANFSALTLLLVFAMFNFPLHSYSFMIVILLIALFGKKAREPERNRWFLTITLSLIFSSTVGLFFCIKNVDALFSYRKSQKSGIIDFMTFNVQYNMLQTNEYFLYNTALRLNESGDFKTSHRLLIELSKIRTGYDIYELIGDNLMQQHRLSEANDAYLKAAHIIPNKFRAKYKLLVLAQQMGRLSEAHFWASCIMTMPIKVPSRTITHIKNYAQLFISNHKQKNEKKSQY